MSITITLPNEFDVENYTGLQSFLTDHLELPQATVDQLPSLIRLAELRLNRKLKVPEREVSATLTTTAGTQTVGLPADFKHARQLKINGASGYPLKLVSLDTLEDYDDSGKPVFYSTHGNQLYFGPSPDAVYSMTLRYSAKLAPLTNNNQTNWLLSDHADAYVYMAASVICQHLGDNASSALYLGFADAVIDEINEDGAMHRQAGHMQPTVFGVP